MGRSRCREHLHSNHWPRRHIFDGDQRVRLKLCNRHGQRLSFDADDMHRGIGLRGNDYGYSYSYC